MKSHVNSSAVWILTVAMAGLFLFSLPLTAQDMGRHHGNRAWPDSLETVTVQGVVVQDSLVHMFYLLDVDGDGVGDYGLAFGPDWYQPESGAQRPQVGDTVEIVGLVRENPMLPVIVVFEIDGMLWREPVENWWHHSQWPDSLQRVTVTGTVLVDTTYFYFHYYLDENNDGEADYFLNFGPPWYQPEGVEKPSAGSIVTVEGGINEGRLMPVIIVYTIDGQTWREPTGPAPWAGRWVHQNWRDSVRIFCPTDSLSWMDIPPGAMHGGGHGGMMFPDSMFVEFMHIFGDSLPGQPDSAMFGFHLNFSNPSGRCMQGRGVPVRFAKRLRIAFHYGNRDSAISPLAKVLRQGNVVLKYWDENAQQWFSENQIEIDPNQEIIYFKTQDVNSYYALTIAGSTTDVEINEAVLPEKISLGQNYPNPFNPSTAISYRVDLSGTSVSLRVYNLNGQLIRTLYEGVQNAGMHQIQWDGRNSAGNLVSSGIYIYKLHAGETTLSRRMIFMK
ncbi:MAG: T9SS type A sorting domain-containing protein [Calditrichaeota bacterium]|nr:T9SS type A sorting domain-containing protein [Calditrichota bacterium]